MKYSKLLITHFQQMYYEKTMILQTIHFLHQEHEAYFLEKKTNQSPLINAIKTLYII